MINHILSCLVFFINSTSYIEAIYDTTTYDVDEDLDTPTKS